MSVARNVLEGLNLINGSCIHVKNLDEYTSSNSIPVFHDVQESPFTMLVERGLKCIRQGRGEEGFALLLLAYEQLTPAQAQIANVLNELVESQLRYQQAQQHLLVAIRRLTEADVLRHTQVITLEKLLLSTASEVIQPPSMSSTNQLAQSYSQLQQDQYRKEGERGESSTSLPPLSIKCFGCFEVQRSGKPVVLCSNRNGQAILRYLVTQPGRRSSADKLMSLFWRDDEPEVAQRKLQVAMSLLRTSLNGEYVCKPGGGYIVCKHGMYQLNPDIPMHIDIDDFLSGYKKGLQDKEHVIFLFEQACLLYTGKFLVEDIYNDWSFIQREQLAQAYLTMCSTLAAHFLAIESYRDTIIWATAVLKENKCEETAYRQLMKAYAAEGRRGEAIYQYQHCVQVLSEELELSPSPETTQLFQSIFLQEPSTMHQALVKQS